MGRDRCIHQGRVNDQGSKFYYIQLTSPPIPSLLTLCSQVYVVANGRYVFDAGSWLSNHPGGQSILKAVAGTDITIDYFHESGYDAKVFIPDLSEPINKEFGLRRRIVAVKRQTMHGMYQSLEDTSNIDGATSPSAPPRKSSAFNGYIPDYRRPRRQSLPLLTPAEQKLLTRCRRSHSHSELALSKLAKYFVGEMSTPANQFDPLEYRRYGIVSKTLITTETSSTPVYRFKFCLLYPYSDVRVGEPDHFSPGQCIEILATNSVDGGEVITRYYTPINGSLTSFEVDVKCEKRGKMSNFLKGLRCGDKQIKIRGPFGRILLDVDRPLFSKVNGNSGKWCYDKIVMVVAGSGMAPAHQMLQYLFLNTHRPLYVHQNYSPENLDEIELQISDFVVIVKHYMDGWAEGINLRTGAQGILPLPCTYPICGPSGGGSPMVTIINSTHRTDDIFGVDTLDAAKCAYPDHLRLIHFVAKNQPKQHEPIRMGTTVMTIRDDDASTTAKEQKSQLLNTFEPVLTKMDNVLYKAGYTTLTEIPGSIISKRLDADSLYDVLLENQLTGDSILGEDNRLYVVCGPDEFNGRFYDTLVGRCRVPHSSIAILPSNKF